MDAMRIGFDVRSYGASGSAHHHEFTQLVLPLSGGFAIEVEGRGAGLAPGLCAFVPPGARHDQEARGHNASLIVDLDTALVPPALADRCGQMCFVRLAPEAQKLVAAIGRAMALPSEGAQRHWVPLLLDALGAAGSPRPRARLVELLAAVSAQPGRAWTVPEMAARAALSVPRLHAVFREELQTSPHAWLAELRLHGAIRDLAETDLPIAEIAARGGYADQSAFTRALRRGAGETPAAFRRRVRER